MAKSSGSNYSFHQEKAKKEEAVGPVGATYKKTDAQGEIISSGRSKFWQKQDIEVWTSIVVITYLSFQFVNTEIN